MTTVEQIVTEARTWLGTPFVHGAGVKGAGCDCAHLITGVYASCGLMPVIEYPIYGPDFWRHAKDPEMHIVATAKQHFREIIEAEAKPGDWFVLYMGRCWAHCGIIVGKDRAIEAWPSHGKVAEINTKTEKLYKDHSRRYFTWSK
jgi:NlpC/P60 family putative phage cell wall peptidase